MGFDNRCVGQSRCHAAGGPSNKTSAARSCLSGKHLLSQSLSSSLASCVPCCDMHFSCAPCCDIDMHFSCAPWGGMHFYCAPCCGLHALHFGGSRSLQRDSTCEASVAGKGTA